MSVLFCCWHFSLLDFGLWSEHSVVWHRSKDTRVVVAAQETDLPKTMSKMSFGPELRGSNITLEKVLQKTGTDNRQTNSVCTMGPACWNVPMLEDLIYLGLSVACFNFSHGDHEGHKACLDRLREAAACWWVVEILTFFLLESPVALSVVLNVISTHFRYYY
jgi:hypothetical protein